jgi:hypothetical protein
VANSQRIIKAIALAYISDTWNLNIGMMSYIFATLSIATLLITSLGKYKKICYTANISNIFIDNLLKERCNGLYHGRNYRHFPVAVSRLYSHFSE